MPVLPAQGMDFDLLIEGLAADQAYTLTVVAMPWPACAQLQIALRQSSVSNNAVLKNAMPKSRVERPAYLRAIVRSKFGDTKTKMITTRSYIRGLRLGLLQHRS